MEKLANTKSDIDIRRSHPDIKGWGIDADPENDPTYPMKHYTGADHDRLNYPRAPQQPVKVEILHSIERPGLTAVFGTSTPPAGLSGMLRRYAFKYSEGSSGHWLTLLLADRVDVVQGIVNDLRHGIIPNIFKERGWTAEWKYNRKAAVQKMVIGTLLITTVVALLTRRSRFANAF
jgi:hypothetical protein